MSGHRHTWLLGRVLRSAGRPTESSDTSVVWYSCACGARVRRVRQSKLLRQTVEYRERRNVAGA